MLQACAVLSCIHLINHTIFLIKKQNAALESPGGPFAPLVGRQGPLDQPPGSRAHETALPRGQAGV